MRADGPTPLRLSFSLRAFVAGCILSLLAAVAVRQWATLATLRRVEEDGANLESKINARIEAYLALLRGAAGYFNSETWLDEARFRRYFAQLEIVQNYPGVQGVGVSVRLTPSEAPRFVQFARTDGWPDFRIWPEGDRPEYHAILFLEPEDLRNRAAIGYDMHTEPARRAAMDRAAATGQPAATGRVTLVQEIAGPKQPGFLVYVPYYHGAARPTTEEQRHLTLAGFAYAAFRTGDFVGALLEPSRLPHVSVAVYDEPAEKDEARVFARSNFLPNDRRPTVTTRRTFRLVDRTWMLVCSAEVTSVVSPSLVAVFGLIASAGLAVLLRGAERARSRAERSEAQTREREGQLTLLIDAVPAMVAYVDRDLVFQLCNRRLVEWTGKTPADIIGRRVEAVVSPEVFQELAPLLQRALAGESVSFERWYRTGSGARFLGTVYVPHRGEDGAIAGVYALTSDLTRHKRAEEAARFVADCGKLLIASMDSESTSRGVVHLAVPRIAEMAVLFRVEGQELVAAAVAHVDEAAERRLASFLSAVRLPLSARHNIGVAARSGLVVVSPEVSGEDLDRVVPDPRQREMLGALQLRSAIHVPVVVRNQIWAVYSFGTSEASGRQFTDEHRGLAEEISTRVRLAVENALLYREAQQEIDVRRKAERVASEAEERFRLLVEVVQDYAIMALDEQGRIESWNEGAKRILGYEEMAALGMPAAQLYRAEDRDAGTPGRELDLARHGGAVSEERWLVRKDQTELWASSHLVPLVDGGAVRGFAWIVRDLTDRKRMEEELERRVQARTAELAEAVQELEAFSYSVSHDLRAPLRSIRGFTELALEEADGRLGDTERNYLQRVERAAARLERLITDLLAYTRISKTRVELRPVDLHALVNDIRHEHPEFQPPQADVATVGTLVPVLGNEAYLTQCLTNLIGNAVKFVKPGTTAVVRLWTERRGADVRLFVRDEGIGIAPELLSRAFQMFERLHTSGSYEGTGVGLAIVRRAVQRMNGTVGVESAPGIGTTFWIELQAP